MQISAFGVVHKAVGEGDMTRAAPVTETPGVVDTKAIRAKLHRARGAWSAPRSPQQARSALRPFKNAAVKAIESR